jgi:hypothetical protein
MTKEYEMTQLYKNLFVAVLLTLGSTTAYAADKDQDRLQDQDRYGWELMTPQERNEHREKYAA